MWKQRLSIGQIKIFLGGMVMDKEEKEGIVIKTFVDVASKYLASFNWSTYGTLNIITNEVTNMLMQEHPGDQEILVIYYNIIFFLKNDISSYVSSRFKQDEMSMIIERIKKNNQKEFDEWFKINIEWKKQCNLWISPIENRLLELLEGK
jgi:hypothetical protein